ncbi:inorganic phosphate transporter [Cystobasidium minutum MCA 4210]|uniref:inorganic phosphate transporter n=1 Tax=Cystobasidium minutum MCA 4210 TaxID=1397322 RepID=UPI0034CD51C4|eukprot:jgi/Rhomi1/162081/estExt_Genewise1Plus.C_5_t20085
MNQQLVTMAVGLGLSQVARRLDLDTPERLFGIRALYFATNAIIFCLYLYIAARVRRRNDNTILKYVEPKPFSGQTGEPPAVVTTTVRNYDLTEVSKAIRGTFMGIAMTMFMHLWMRFTQPLLVSSLTVWIGLWRSNIVRLYLRGQEGAEDLKRPFKPGGPSFMAGSGPQTDKASIEAAEKANLLYRKEEF